MNCFLLVSLSLVALAAANPASSGVYVEYLRRGGIQCRSNCRTSVRPHADCPIVNCPPAVRDGTCGIPDCTLQGNLLRLHPHRDPNYYYQCRRVDDWGRVEALVRACGCGTVFSARVDETRCVHPEEWLPDCQSQPARWEDIVLSRLQCRVECETCDDNNQPPVNVPPPVNPPPVIPPPVENPPGGDNCQCPCMPCIWFPCMPCQSNCACNGNNNNNNNNNRNNINNPPQQIRNPQPPRWQPEQPQQPTNPWQPQPPQQPWQPQPPQQPWQPQPPQWNPNQPHNPWDTPQQQPIIPIQPIHPWERPAPPQNEWQNRPHWYGDENKVEAQSEEKVIPAEEK